jgi:hypothetical protein
MQTRHRIPTIFNLSMVDVLCCALGCVILLWLVWFKEARRQALDAGQTTKQLSDSKAQLARLTKDLDAARQQIVKVSRVLDGEKLAVEAGKQRHEYLSGQYAEATSQRDQLLTKAEKTDRALQTALADLKDAQAHIAALQKDLKKLETANAAVGLALAQKIKDFGFLATQLLAATTAMHELEKMVADQKGNLATTAGQAAELKSKLGDAEKYASKLEQQASTLKTQSKETGDLLAKAEARAVNLAQDLDKKKTELADALKRYDELLALKKLLDDGLLAAKTDRDTSAKELAEVRKRYDELVAVKKLLDEGMLAARTERDKSAKELAEAKLINQNLVTEAKGLAQQVGKLKAASDNRFAGIELTGTRVLFLVDMSGSMGMTDSYKEDPDKWPLVCEILGKLIQSLTDLKQFQIILFSDKIRYPMGSDGKWHEYKGSMSVKAAVAAVKAVSPVGATNMSIVFEEAFRYRAQGLDTIYLLSDGLPNVGDGLPAGADKWTEEQRGAALGKYIRDRLKKTWNTPQGAAKQRVRINAVGFYFDSPDVGAFLWALARDNDGSFVGLSKP